MYTARPPGIEATCFRVGEPGICLVVAAGKALDIVPVVLFKQSRYSGRQAVRDTSFWVVASGERRAASGKRRNQHGFPVVQAAHGVPTFPLGATTSRPIRVLCLLG